MLTLYDLMSEEQYFIFIAIHLFVSELNRSSLIEGSSI